MDLAGGLFSQAARRGNDTNDKNLHRNPKRHPGERVGGTPKGIEFINYLINELLN